MAWLASCLKASGVWHLQPVAPRSGRPLGLGDSTPPLGSGDTRLAYIGLGDVDSYRDNAERTSVKNSYYPQLQLKNKTKTNKWKMAFRPVLLWLSAVVLSVHNVPRVHAEDCNEVQLNKAKLRCDNRTTIWVNFFKLNF